MTAGDALFSRAANKCELCGSADALDSQKVTGLEEGEILSCEECRDQIAKRAPLDIHHWHCLKEAAWSDLPEVQIISWRLLSRLDGESWASELREMIYLDDETLAIAHAGLAEEIPDGVEHRDSNGALLGAGDTVSLIKDLPVKGAGFTAKRGTSVRNISLVADNPEHIEGRVNGQQIVILTKFVKKA